MLSQYAQQHWTREDGLPQNSVVAITQTADGYLWIGTEQGLARFDGMRFVSLELVTADGRPDALVNTLYADGDALWVGTSRGLHRIEDGEPVEILTAEGAPVGVVQSILRDGAGRLWIATKPGVFQLRDGSARLFAGVEGEVPAESNSLAESEDARLCVAEGRALCLEGGVFREERAFTAAADGSRIEFLAFDSAGDLWAGTTGGGLLHMAQGEVRRIDARHGLPHDFVRALAVDRADGVWVGCGVSTVARVGRRGLEVLDLGEGRAGSGVISLFEDREGNLWIGTSGGGLIRLSEPLFTVYSSSEGLRRPSVRCVLEDRRGTVWIGTAGGGLHRLDDGRISAVGPEEGLEADDVIALAEDGQGRLWVGTGGAGVFVRQNGLFEAVKSDAQVIFSLHEDRHGRMWAGALGAVLRLEEGRFQAVEELRTVNASAIVSRDGDLWFASWKSGPVRWRDGEVTRFGPDQGFPGDMTLTVFRDSAGALWVGSHLGGLTRLVDDEVFTFTTAHGLCDDSVFAILEGPAGHLWLTSNIGVFAVAMDQLDAVARGLQPVVDCRLFGTADGMRSSECNGGQQPAAWRDSHDNLWFATTDGVVRVDPLGVARPEAPPVVVEKLVSGGKSVGLAESRELELPPDRRELEIRYTAMTLTASEKVRFRYRLDGLDREWVEVGERRVAYYTNLSPRRYRFRVQAQRPGGSWGEESAATSFRLHPRFFETWWFLGLALCGVVSLAIAAHRGRVAVVQRKAHRLERLVAERTSDLAEVNSTLERRIEEGIEALRESDRMAAYGHLVAGVAHEVRHPIFALRAASHLLTQKLSGSQETEEELEILERETDRMNRLVDDLLELGRPRQLEPSPCRPGELIEEALKSMSGQEGELRFEKDVDSSVPQVLADRPAIIQVLVNLLQNAVRHAAGARRVVVSAHLDPPSGMVHFTVDDDGQGLSVKDQSRIFEPFYSGSGGIGLGLAIAARLVREHGGRVSVESRPGEGTVFTVALEPAPESA